jgi:hypothetical protein
VKKVENILDYQRSISIQTAVLRYQLSSDEFLQQVANGENVHELEKLEIFERVLPRPQELQRLREAVIQNGWTSMEEAQYGQVEQFVYKVMKMKGIDRKVKVMIRMSRFINRSNEYFIVSNLCNLVIEHRELVEDL